MQSNADQSSDRNDATSSHRRVTVPEAAQILGISPEAVRARIRRGTLAKEKDADGTVYVRLNGDQTRLNDTAASDETDDHTRSNGDETTVQGVVEVLERQNEFLRQQLEQEREANRENRRLLAAALERIPPQLESPSEGPGKTRESPETPAEDPYSTHAPPGADGPVPSEPRKRSWWREFLGIE